LNDSQLAGQLEGILQFADERQDGQLRDPQHLLRPVRGNITVPRQLIRDMHLRPGLLLSGSPRGRTLNKVDTIEGARRTNTSIKLRLRFDGAGSAADVESSSTTGRTDDARD